ncbi:MAG: diguanylate cyclase [Myxococcales bacterium]|nr:diguanylate cyclase [Myxococcales bacterium]
MSLDRRPTKLSTKVFAFVSATTLASAVVVSWIAIEALSTELDARLRSSHPASLARQEHELREQLASRLAASDAALEDVLADPDRWPVLEDALAAASRSGALALALVDVRGRTFAGVLTPPPDAASLAPLLPLLTEPAEIPAADDALVGVATPLGPPDAPVAYLVGGVPRSVAGAPIRAAALRILVAAACLVALFSLIAQRILRRWIEPVGHLSQVARRVSRGELDVDLDAPEFHRRDEIGVLARTFDQMLLRLRTNQREIERSNAELRERNGELRRANEVLSQLSITDGLTKLHNHRHFQDLFARETKRSDRTGEPLSLMLIDLDDFKQLNDRYGHAAGDQVLARLAGILNERVRETDVVARYGGEEFVVLSPSTDLVGARVLAEKIRLAVEQSGFPVDEHDAPLLVSVSVGVAQYTGHAKRFFRAADAALYRA